jgi:hypothetical protein
MSYNSSHPFDFVLDFADALDISVSEASPSGAIEAGYSTVATISSACGCTGTLSTIASSIGKEETLSH